VGEAGIAGAGRCHRYEEVLALILASRFGAEISAPDRVA
jgi:hypothetical protein